MFQILSEATTSIVRIIKEKYDKFYSLIISCLWVFSTLGIFFLSIVIGVIECLDFIPAFFFVFMSLYFIIPGKIPKIMTNYFGLISNTLGRSITMVVFSLLFLGD